MEEFSLILISFPFSENWLDPFLYTKLVSSSYYSTVLTLADSLLSRFNKRLLVFPSC